MSVVAVKLNKDTIEISADNQVSYGGNKLYGEDRGKHPAKIFKTNDIIFGTAGYTSVASMFRLFCETRKPESATELGILNFLSEFDDWGKSKDNSFKLENNFIIIFENKVFSTSEFEVNSIESYSAIGSGMFLALGAMYMGADTKKAVDVAKKYDLYCGGDTVSLSIKLS